jgi:ADP-ribose pyrophosphatase YjhB (NUDIX family)
MSFFLSQENYDFIYSKSTRLCVDILIEAMGYVILTKRHIEPYKGKFHLPGGRVRFRETVANAIQRIAKDELGTNLKSNMKLVGWMEFLNEKQGGNKRHTISLVFKCEPIDNNSMKNGVWFNALPKNILPVHKKFLIDNKFL